MCWNYWGHSLQWEILPATAKGLLRQLNKFKKGKFKSLSCIYRHSWSSFTFPDLQDIHHPWQGPSHLCAGPHVDAPIWPAVSERGKEDIWVDTVVSDSAQTAQYSLRWEHGGGMHLGNKVLGAYGMCLLGKQDWCQDSAPPEASSDPYTHFSPRLHDVPSALLLHHFLNIFFKCDHFIFFFMYF